MRRGDDSLELVLRFRAANGWLRGEHIIRDNRVELRSYHPGGELAGYLTDLPLDTYVTEVAKLRSIPSAPERDS